MLVIDDDPAIRETLCELLRAEGFGADSACDGVEALERLSAPERPAVILLDLMMPRLNGAGLLREIQGDLALASIPVVVMTGAGTLANAPLADAYVRKPLDAERLMDLIRRSVWEASPGA